ncbi:MAG: DnaA/Hda family protein [Pseudomonadota bacterium]
MKQLLLDIKPAAPPTLQNFVAGRNAEALASLEMAVHCKKNQAISPRFIYVWGESGSGKSHLLKACKAVGANVADDVHLLDKAAQIDLFNQYNQRKEAGEFMITAGLHAPTQMGLRDDLATRLAWGLVYQLHPLNDIEKATALKQHAFERGMKLPDEVVDYCLRYLRRDLPTLMATLDALDEWSLTMQKPITVPMLRKLLQLNLEL